MATTATPWAGNEADKLYLQSGQFTSTLKTSVDVSAVDATVTGISWDGANTPWSGDQANKLYLQSGQFTSTLKTSQASKASGNPTQASWDGTNTPSADNGYNQILLFSGQFTSTIKDSQGSISGQGISYDGTNSPYNTAGKIFLRSGQFTSTIKDSEDTSGVDSLATGISWDGTNTPWCGRQADKLYLQSGQHTSTLKTSEDVSAVDNEVQDIDTDDWESRLDSDITFVSTTSNSFDNNSASFSYDATGADALVVFIAVDDSNSDPTAVTYNSVSLTEEVTRTSTGRYAGMWSLIAPATGSNTLAVTLRDSGDAGVVVVGLAGVDQDDMVEATGSGSGGSSEDTSVSITTATAKAWVVGGVEMNDDTTGAASQNPATVEHFDGVMGSGAGDYAGVTGTRYIPTAGATSDDWTMGNSSQDWQGVAVSVKPAADAEPETGDAVAHPTLLLMGAG